MEDGGAGDEVPAGPRGRAGGAAEPEGAEGGAPGALVTGAGGSLCGWTRAQGAAV